MATVRQKKSGIPEGLYESKMVTICFENSSKKGQKQAVIEWVVIGVVESADMAAAAVAIGKKFTMKFTLEGEHEELGKDGLAEALDSIATGFDLDQYNSEAGLAALFLKLNAMTIIRFVRRKMNRKGTFMNAYFAREPKGYKAGGENWGTQPTAPATPAAPAPAAPPAPVAPATPEAGVELWANTPEGVKLLPESAIADGTMVMSKDQSSGWYEYKAPVKEEAPATPTAPVAPSAPAVPPAPAADKPAKRKSAAPLFGE